MQRVDVLGLLQKANLRRPSTALDDLGNQVSTSLPTFAAPLRFTSSVEFYRAEPTAVTSWRMAVLMGANSRTYKFALGSALLELARRGQDSVPLNELAAPYAMHLVERAQRYPQGPTSTVSGSADFLAVLREESAASQRAGAPTERLLAAAIASMPQMVMQKFHNLRSTGEVPHRFYEVQGKGSSRRVALTADLLRVATHAGALALELDARWSIVEACFDAEIGRQLVTSGVTVSPDGLELRAHPPAA